MDLTSLFGNETRQNFKWLMTAIDMFSKFGYAVPMKNKDIASIHAAFNVMLQKITDNGRHQIGSLRTDNGSEFKSAFIQDYLQRKNIKQVFSNAYTPQSNGQVEKWNGILKRLIYMNLHKNQKYDWVGDLDNLVKNYNDAYQTAIKTSPALAQKGALENAGDAEDLDGEFGKNAKGATLANIKKSKEKTLGKTEVKFKVGDKVRIALEAIKPAQERAPAIVTNIDRIKWTKEIYTVRQVNNPKNGVSAPYYYVDGKYDGQQFYSQHLQPVDEIEAPTETTVRYIVSGLLYPLIKNNQPHYRVRWKYYRKANEQTEEPRTQLLDDVPLMVRRFEEDWQVEFIRTGTGWKIVSFGFEVGTVRGLPDTAAQWFNRAYRSRIMSKADENNN